MGDVITILGNAAASPITYWLAGLVASFRLIAPAEKFLSARSAAWLSAQIQGQQGGSMKRRFALAFKRYVDRTFDARQRRLGRCRFWLLSFWRCATVSLLTFLALFWTLALFFGLDAMQAEFIAESRPILERLEASARLPFAPGVMTAPGMMEMLFWISMVMLSVGGAFANILPDYLSFLETRNFIARMGRGFTSDVLLIFADLLLSLSIALLAVFLLAFPFTVLGETLKTGGNSIMSENFAITLSLLPNALRPFFGATDLTMVEFLPTLALFLSTFATSVWIWVFFSGMGLLRAGVLLAPVLRLVRFLVDVDDHPFRAAWLMFAILWTVGMGALAIIG